MVNEWDLQHDNASWCHRERYIITVCDAFRYFSGQE